LPTILSIGAVIGSIGLIICTGAVAAPLVGLAIGGALDAASIGVGVGAAAEGAVTAGEMAAVGEGAVTAGEIATVAETASGISESFGTAFCGTSCTLDTAMFGNTFETSASEFEMNVAETAAEFEPLSIGDTMGRPVYHAGELAEAADDLYFWRYYSDALQAVRTWLSGLERAGWVPSAVPRLARRAISKIWGPGPSKRQEHEADWMVADENGNAVVEQGTGVEVVHTYKEVNGEMVEVAQTVGGKTVPVGTQVDSDGRPVGSNRQPPSLKDLHVTWRSKSQTDPNAGRDEPVDVLKWEVKDGIAHGCYHNYPDACGTM
jgi:hypothetical protein